MSSRGEHMYVPLIIDRLSCQSGNEHYSNLAEPSSTLAADCISFRVHEHAFSALMCELFRRAFVVHYEAYKPTTDKPVHSQLTNN